MDVVSGGYTLTLECKDLDITEDRFIDHQDPYLVISQDGRVIYTSETHTATSASHYNPFYLGVDMVGGLDKTITVEAYVALSTGGRGFIGGSTFTLRSVLLGDHQVTLINPEKARRFQSYRNSGMVEIKHIQVGPVQGNSQLDKPYVFAQLQPF